MVCRGTAGGKKKEDTMMVWRHITGRRAFLLAALLAALSFSVDAHAQRTMNGQFFMGAEGRWPLGADIGVGQYLQWGYWHAGITADRLSRSLSAGQDGDRVSLEFWHPMAEGGLMARIVATRSRSLSLYAGGTGTLGVEFYDPFRKVPSGVVVVLPSGGSPVSRKFIFGFCPRLEMEWYLGARTAIVIAARAPMAFGSQMRWISADASLGLRINMDW